MEVAFFSKKRHYNIEGVLDYFQERYTCCHAQLEITRGQMICKISKAIWFS